MTLPLFGTLSAEPASHDIAQVTVVKGGAKAIDFNRAGGFDVDSVSKSGTSAFHGQAGYRFQNAGMSAELNNGSLARYDQDRAWTDRNVGGPILDRTTCSSTARTTARPATRQNASNAYGDLPELRQRPQRGLRQADVHADARRRSSTPAIATRSALDKGSLFGQFTARHGRHRQRSLAEDRHRGRVVGHQRDELPDLQVHALREPDARAVPTTSRAPSSTRRSARTSTSPTSTSSGCSRCPSRAPDAAFNAFVQPVINRYGYIPNGVPTGGGIVGFGSHVRRRQLLPRRRPGRLQPHAVGHGPAPQHPRGYQQYDRLGGSDPQLERLGLDHRARRRHQLPAARRSSTRRRSSSRGSATCRRSTPSSARRASRSTTRSAGRTGRSTSASSPATTRCTARGSERRSTLSGFVKATGTTSESRKYKMYEVPFSKMLQPRLERDLGLQREGHGLRELRAVQPGGQLAAARRVVGPQPAVDASTPTSTPTATCSRSSPSRPRPASCSCQDLTPRRINEFLVGTAQQFTPGLTGRAYFRYRKGTHYWEDTNNNARDRRSTPPAGHSAARSTSPTWQRSARRRSAAARPTSSPSSTARSRDYYELTLETEYRKGKALRARLVHLQPLLRQLRPGQLDDRRLERREHLHRLVEHRRRRRAASCGTSSSARCAAIGRTRSSSTARTALPLARLGRRLRDRPVGPAVGDAELPAVRALTTQHQRHGPVRRAGRLAPIGRRTRSWI